MNFDLSNGCKDATSQALAVAKECRINTYSNEVSEDKNLVIQSMLQLHQLSKENHPSVVGIMSIFHFMEKAWEYYEEKSAEAELKGVPLSRI